MKQVCVHSDNLSFDGSEWNDPMACKVMKKLTLPTSAMCARQRMLTCDSLATKAGMSSHWQTVLTDSCNARWFAVQHRSVVCRTTKGTVPGGLFGCLLYNLCMAHILRQVRQRLQASDVTTSTPAQQQGTFRTFDPDASTETMAIAYVTYVVDTVLPIESGEAMELCGRAEATAIVVSDTLKEHALIVICGRDKAGILLPFI